MSEAKRGADGAGDEIRRRDLAQDDIWIGRFFSEVEVGYVATRWEETSFITPVTFWYDLDAHRIIFHTHRTGRLRQNAERGGQATFAASRHGRPLPSNAALEFSIQYESAVAYGPLRILDDQEEERATLYGLIAKYFPEMEAGKHYRPIQDGELDLTTVYELQVECWSGKRNWKERADQTNDWPALPESFFE